MEYEVYRHEDATDEEFEEITACFRQILTEDKDLCTGSQKNLSAGIFLNGELHPRVEKVGLRRRGSDTYTHGNTSLYH